MSGKKSNDRPVRRFPRRDGYLEADVYLGAIEPRVRLRLVDVAAETAHVVTLTYTEFCALAQEIDRLVAKEARQCAPEA